MAHALPYGRTATPASVGPFCSPHPRDTDVSLMLGERKGRDQHPLGHTKDDVDMLRGTPRGRPLDRGRGRCSRRIRVVVPPSPAGASPSSLGSARFVGPVSRISIVRPGLLKDMACASPRLCSPCDLGSYITFGRERMLPIPRRTSTTTDYPLLSTYRPFGVSLTSNYADLCHLLKRLQRPHDATMR